MSKIIRILKDDKFSKSYKINIISDMFYEYLYEEGRMFDLSFVSSYLESKKVDNVIRDMKLDKNHVIDENKSVKWNREQVELFNQNLKFDIKHIEDKYKELFEIIVESLIDSYSKYYDLPDKVVRFIVNKHSDLNSCEFFINRIENDLDLVSDLE